MSYTDASLAVQGGYTYIHGRQPYDQLSSQLSVHPAWQFVESVDFVSGLTTYTTYVWKNLSSVSGMGKDWYVAFQTILTSGLYTVTDGLRAFLFEDYNSTTHTATKYANRINNTSTTLNSDASYPGSWVLTAAYPNADPAVIHQTVLHPVVNGGTTGYTSMRMLTVISNTTIVVLAQVGGGLTCQFYLGGFDTLLGSTLDPLPIVIGQQAISGFGAAKTNISAGNGFFATTRHPGLGGAAGTAFNNFGPGRWPSEASGGPQFTQGPVTSLVNGSQSGFLGNTGDGNASFWLGVPVSRLSLSQCGGGGLATTRGGLRGLLKHVYSAAAVTHSFGDTFLVDGVPLAGQGLASSGNTLFMDAS